MYFFMPHHGDMAGRITPLDSRSYCDDSGNYLWVERYRQYPVPRLAAGDVLAVEFEELRHRRHQTAGVHGRAADAIGRNQAGSEERGNAGGVVHAVDLHLREIGRRTVGL